jgi:hypothetical protein
MAAKTATASPAAEFRMFMDAPIEDGPSGAYRVEKVTPEFRKNQAQKTV